MGVSWLNIHVQFLDTVTVSEQVSESMSMCVLGQNSIRMYCTVETEYTDTRGLIHNLRFMVCFSAKVKLLLNKL